jgi:hypothetical protein
MCVDRMIERMWEVRDRLVADETNEQLWQQWAFIRRVIARAINRMPTRRPVGR